MANEQLLHVATEVLKNIVPLVYSGEIGKRAANANMPVAEFMALESVTAAKALIKLVDETPNESEKVAHNAIAEAKSAMGPIIEFANAYLETFAPPMNDPDDSHLICGRSWNDKNAILTVGHLRNLLAFVGKR